MIRRDINLGIRSTISHTLATAFALLLVQTVSCVTTVSSISTSASSSTSTDSVRPLEKIALERWAVAMLQTKDVKHCWRRNYPNTAGIPMVCSTGKEKRGALCYTKCKDGYKAYGGALHTCYEKVVCPRGMEERGTTGEWCFRYRWDITDPCPDGWYDDKSTCAKKRKSYNRGGPSVLDACRAGFVRSGALCYPTCHAGYHEVGPVCWADCPVLQSWGCAAGCAISSGACGTAIFDMIKSIVVFVMNVIAALVPGASQIIAVIQQILQATQEVSNGISQRVQALIEAGEKASSLVETIYKNAGAQLYDRLREEYAADVSRDVVKTAITQYVQVAVFGTSTEDGDGWQIEPAFDVNILGYFTGETNGGDEVDAVLKQASSEAIGQIPVVGGLITSAAAVFSAFNYGKCPLNVLPATCSDVADLCNTGTCKTQWTCECPLETFGPHCTKYSSVVLTKSPTTAMPTTSPSSSPTSSLPSQMPSAEPTQSPTTTTYQPTATPTYQANTPTYKANTPTYQAGTPTNQPTATPTSAPTTVYGSSTLNSDSTQIIGISSAVVVIFVLCVALGLVVVLRARRERKADRSQKNNVAVLHGVTNAHYSFSVPSVSDSKDDNTYATLGCAKAELGVGSENATLDSTRDEVKSELSHEQELNRPQYEQRGLQGFGFDLDA